MAAVVPRCCRWRCRRRLQWRPLPREMRRSAARLLLPAPWLQGPRAEARRRPTHQQPLATLQYDIAMTPAAVVAWLWPADPGQQHSTGLRSQSSCLLPPLLDCAGSVHKAHLGQETCPGWAPSQQSRGAPCWRRTPHPQGAVGCQPPPNLLCNTRCAHNQCTRLLHSLQP